MQTGYRRDIDGLRAVAVMGVVLYHYGLVPLGAGFAGVDVFFVISGFLIGGIILEERAAGTFSYRTFYMRRVRRILPALVAMMLLVAPMAALVMTPNELRYFGGGAMAALLFVSNLWFYFRIDYFNPGAALDPLVHTWSLGVEEQFYLVVPLVLIWLGGRRSWLTWAAVGTIAAASLVSMLVHHGQYGSASFYMIQYRAWELAAGVLAALALRGPASRVPGAVAATFSTAGLALVAGALVWTPGDVPWPGPWTLLPVTGTALVLLFGGRISPATRALSLPPFVGVGLISYSLYLWHQPLHSLAILARRDEQLPPALRLGLLAVALVLAWASWRLVEQPYRRGALETRGGRRLLWGATAALAIFAVGGHVSRGYPQRMPEAAQAAILFEDSKPPSYERCAGRRPAGDGHTPAELCTHGAEGVPASVALWGDSHAAVIAQPLGQAIAPAGLALMEFTLGGCPPIPDVIIIEQMTNTAARKSDDCPDFVADVRDHILADPDLQTVVLFAYWNSYAERRDFDAMNGRVKSDKAYAVPLGASSDLSEADRLAALGQGLAGLVGQLTGAGKTVLVIYPLPEAPFSVPQNHAWALWKDRVTAADTNVPRAAFDDYSTRARAILDGLGALPGLVRLDATDRLCTGTSCMLVTPGGIVLYRDSHHLSLPGSALVVPDIAAQIIAIAGGGQDAGQ